jgi:hypothetical protein
MGGDRWESDEGILLKRGRQRRDERTPVEGEGRWRKCAGEEGAGGDGLGHGWSGRKA